MNSYKNLFQNNNIPLYTQTSNGWINPGQKNNYAVNLDVGINDYIFSRTTPDNNFITKSNITLDNLGFQMVGGKNLKNKSNIKKEKRPTTKNEKKPTTKNEKKSTTKNEKKPSIKKEKKK